MQRLAGRRSRASPLSTSANCVSNGVVSTKLRRPPNVSRELLLRAVAYRMQEVALGGLSLPRQRQLRQVAQQFKQTGAANSLPRPELKPGTRLIREWQGRTYDVLVLDDGF